MIRLGSYIAAFIVGGLFCVVGQLLLDLTKLSPAHVLVSFVVAGGIASGLNLYEPLIEFAGAGAFIPISSFGNSLVQGAIFEATQYGIIGVLTGMFELTSTGITAAIIFGFIMAVVFDPKG